MKFTLITFTCALICLQTVSASPAIKRQFKEIPVNIGGINYLFGESIFGKIPWDEADRECRQQNYTLASFETQAEYIAVRDYLYENQEYDLWRWISGKEIDGVWKWTATGVDFTDTNWSNNEPEVPAGTPSSCVNFIAYGLFFQEVGWQADDCDYQLASYMCEEPVA